MNSSSINCDLKSVLIIDDDEIFRAMLKTFFVKLLPDAKYDFYDPVKQGTPADDFNWSQYDLLMMDYDLGNGENGLDWLRKYKSGEIISCHDHVNWAHGNEEIAVEAMRFGAQDYINKTKLSLDRLGQAVNNAMEKRQKQDLLSSTLTLQSNIFNKVHFYKKIKEAIESQVEGKFSFLLHIQINKYKEIYEQHGLLLTDNYHNTYYNRYRKINP
jgi:DNA-binding NtrC family response regulator